MINPHFLYNTLDQLNWMAIENGQEKISKVLELVGKMLRLSLSKGEQFITVRDELQILDCYIRIQQIRWRGAIHFEIAVPEELQDVYIPKITLQPFVENAIMHGFHGKHGGTIKINGEMKADSIVLSVWDDGIGIDHNWKQIHQKTGGYGIRNVKERLSAYFQKPYGIQLLNHGNGTVVYIRLPTMYSKHQFE